MDPLRLKILVVEDDVGIRSGLSTLLRMEGYEALEAADGRQGLEQARTHRPDLILCDVMMPELDGYAMLERLRSEPATAHIPLVFLTALSQREDTRRGMNLGADDYIAKPFTRQEVLDAIASTFKRHRTHENRVLKQTISSLEEAERIAQHDLKTPLGSLAAAPALLRAARGVRHQEEAVLGMMELAANRAMRLVNLSRDIYQMENGSYRFQAGSVDLGALATAVAQDLASHAQSKRVAIHITGNTPPVYAIGEDTLCYSILSNLTKNAVEAAPEGSTVSMHLRTGARASLCIHNQGAVPEALRDRFFGKYASVGKVGGAGLGTYSSQLLAQAQNGSLRMVSCDAEGTRLTLELDPAPAPPSEAPGMVVALATAPASAARDGPPLRVLLVDDDAFNLLVLSELFTEPGISIATADNGRLALDAVAQQRPDLVIMDMDMPIMNGTMALQGIRRLQAAAGQASSHIVAYSGFDDAQSQTSQLAEGFDACLAKPTNRAAVVALLEAVGRTKT